MTDQADTPDPIGEWLRRCDRAEDRARTRCLARAEVCVDSRQARALADEVRALRAEVDQAQSERDAHRSARDWYEQQLRERTAELAAARDREAAVRAIHYAGIYNTFVGEQCAHDGQRWPCPTVAALSQSEPTKETP